MAAYTYHVEKFHSFFATAAPRLWRGEECRKGNLALAAECIELARARVPCMSLGASNYPLFSFLGHHVGKRTTEQFDALFQAYVENDYFDLNAPIRAPKRLAARSLYRKFIGLLPLEAAVRESNDNIAVLMIRLGARTDIPFDGEDFLSFVRSRYAEFKNGRGSGNPIEAHARLTNAIMRRTIESHASAAAAEPAPLRRRASL